jgi:hypothetical protein
VKCEQALPPLKATRSTLCAINNHSKDMKVILFAFFFFSMICHSYAQSDTISPLGITAKLRNFEFALFHNHLVDSFFNIHGASFSVYPRSSNSELRREKSDTSRVNRLSIMRFTKLPLFDSTSGGGRLQVFTSVCADGSCIYESSLKVYFSFETLNEARQFVGKLLACLRGPKIQEGYRKSEYEEMFTYSFYVEDTGKYNYFVCLKLSLVRSADGYDLEIF